MDQQTIDTSAWRSWERAFLTVLGEAIADLRERIFEEGWDALVAEAGGTEGALRESVRYYERALAHLFGFVRAAGFPASSVAWSEFKANLRRAELEAGQEITLRTALDSALYASEQIPLAEHARFREYVAVLTRLLAERANRAAPPGFRRRTLLEERLEWAYALVSDLEDHAAFHAQVVAAIRDTPGIDTDGVLALETRLIGLQRFDLILSTCLLWLAETEGNPAS